MGYHTVMNEKWKLDIVQQKALDSIDLYRSCLNCFNQDKKKSAAIKRLQENLRWFLDNQLLSNITHIDLETILSAKTASELKSCLAPHILQLKKFTQNESVKVMRGDALFRPESPSHGIDLVVLCDNIKSANNFGNIIRTSECLGFSAIHSSGITAPPNSQKVFKTSMGAELFIDWVYHKSTQDGINHLKSLGYMIICLETIDNPPPLSKVREVLKQEAKIAVVLGNETNGLPKDILEQSDIIAALPVYGAKNSLNVVNAFSAFMYTVLN